MMGPPVSGHLKLEGAHNEKDRLASRGHRAAGGSSSFGAEFWVRGIYSKSGDSGQEPLLHHDFPQPQVLNAYP